MLLMQQSSHSLSLRSSSFVPILSPSSSSLTSLHILTSDAKGKFHHRKNCILTSLNPAFKISALNLGPSSKVHTFHAQSTPFVPVQALATKFRPLFLQRGQEFDSDQNYFQHDHRHRHMLQARRGFLAEVESLKEEKNAASAAPLEFESPLEIVKYPDPRLRLPNRRIIKFDESLQRLADEMMDLMYKTDGVGLSAPQVGVNVQLMVFNPEGEKGKGKEYVLVNPKIAKYAKATDVLEEGCLSFPNIYADVERALGVKVDAFDVKGRKFSLSLKNWQARIFQHEFDHLERVLFFDRMTPDALQTIRSKLLDLEEEYKGTTGQDSPESVAKSRPETSA